MRTVQTLDLRAAQTIAQAAFDLSIAEGVAQNIALVDAWGALLLFLRMDGAKVIAGPIAINKAFTAAAAQTRTDAIAPRTQPGEAGYMIQTQLGGRFTTLGGGVPILSAGVVVGGIGISGGSVAQDVQIAEAAALAAVDGNA
jgi:uncharacterized protein GlcG (DUF336 family)